MLLTNYLQALVEASRKERSLGFRILLLSGGVAVFIVALPAVLFLAVHALEARLVPVGSLQKAFAVLFIALGIFLAGWTVLTQIAVGKGTPVPVAPPKKLIVTGPYRLCRNPMQLGVIIYYLGVGTLLGSMEIGLAMFLLGLAIGGAYHKFVEEKELRLRFGEEYEEYRKKTPFLIPKW